MKLYRHIVFLFIFGSKLFAANFPCPNPVQFYADFLYLMPGVENTYFVQVSNIQRSTSDPFGPRLNNNFQFKPGYRIGAEYIIYPTERSLQIFYTKFKEKQTRNVDGNEIYRIRGTTDMDPLQYSGSATSKLKLEFQRIDGIFCQKIINAHGLFFYIQPGIEFVDLLYNQEYTYLFPRMGDIAIVSEKSKSWGTGPQLGIELNYTFYQSKKKKAIASHSFSQSSSMKKFFKKIQYLCINSHHRFDIVGSFSGSLIPMRLDYKQRDVAFDTNLDDLYSLEDESHWEIIPALHTKLGFNYLLTFDSASLDFEVGYELSLYTNILQNFQFITDFDNPTAITQFNNFSLQGLYISGRLSF